VRVLHASTRGAGHFNPLVPFIEACLRAGHEVLVAGPPPLAPAVEAAGYAFRVGAAPPDDELSAAWARVPTVSPDEQNAIVVGEIFAQLNVRAMLPHLRAVCEEWRPDVVLRDPAEYASAVAAELAGIPHVRIGVGLASVEELGLDLAAPKLAEARAAVDLEPDPGGERIRESPYLTDFPASLDDPPIAGTRRFRDPAADVAPRPLPDWWPDGEQPLVYVTFGSVAAGLPMAGAVYGAAIEAVADLPARVLLTVGREGDPSAFGALPPNLRVERWVPQAHVLGHAGAVVCHGCSGTTVGTLAAGLPLVVVPLFADQPDNARRVAEVGAGLAVAPPGPAGIRAAIERVLEEGSFRAAAARLAEEMRGLPPVDDAIAALPA
jgi:UDP:flavonoid glycosyltransferase YjiC (YdhE family)